jgi:hypothetical protein
VRGVRRAGVSDPEWARAMSRRRDTAGYVRGPLGLEIVDTQWCTEQTSVYSVEQLRRLLAETSVRTCRTLPGVTLPEVTL